MAGGPDMSHPMRRFSRSGIGRLWRASVLVLVAVLCAGERALALPLYVQPFDTDTANTTATLTTYPEFSSFTSPGDPSALSVLGGVLNMQRATSPKNVLSMSGYLWPWLLVDVDIGGSGEPGDYYVGMTIGSNELQFHPGFISTPGAFRVTGPGGFGLTDMGFVPDPDVLHHMTVGITEATGEFQILVTDALDEANVFTTSFTNPGYAGGDVIGLHVGGVGGSGGLGLGLFDNLTVHPVPEPSTLCLLGFAGWALLWRRRKRPD